VTTKFQKIEGAFDYAVCAWLGLPLAIWLLFWFAWYVSLPCLVLLVWGLWSVAKSKAKPLSEIDAASFFDLKKWIPLVLLAAVWVFFSGLGAAAHQNPDFDGRNALFWDLINQDWPVVFDYSRDAVFAEKMGSLGLMNYYFAFWLPAAGVAKMFGLAAGNVALYLWSLLGVVLTLYLLQRYLQRFAKWAVLIFILFSGLDILGYLVVYRERLFAGLPFGTLLRDLFTTHKEWWSGRLQYSSFSTQLYWVFNQALPAWLVTFLMLTRQNRKQLIFICALMLPFAPLPFISALTILLFSFLFGQDALAPMAENLPVRPRLWDLPSDKPARPRLWDSFMEMLTLPNLLCVFAVAPIGLLFLLNNETGHKGLIFERFLPPNASAKEITDFLILLFSFYLLEFGLYVIFLRKLVNKRLLWLVTIVLLVVPLFYVGRGNDWCMRVSVPLLCVLAGLVIHGLSKAKSWRKALLICLLALGAFTSLSEIYRSVSATVPAYIRQSNPDFAYKHWKTFSTSKNSDGTTNESKVYILDNYVIPYQENRWIEKYLLRRPTN